MKITSVVAKRFGNYQTKPSVLYGVIGDLSTSIIEVPNKTSMIYVTLEHSGIVLPNILNVRVPNLLGTRVKIGFDPITFPGILQVLGIRDLYYKDVDNPGIGPVWHHKQHEWPNPDAVYSRGEQLLPSMYYPIAGTLTAGIYPNAYRLSTGWKVVDQITIVSLAASVASITSGNAMCALIVVDDSGTFVARPGALVAEQASPFISAYMMLTDADIPEPVAGDHTICGVKLYYGQTTLRCNGNVNDFIDLRFSGASGGGSGGHIIMDEGEALPAEPNLDFAGDGVTVTDVPGDSKSLVTIPGSAGDVTGPDTNTDNYIPQWDGADSKALKDGLLLVTSVGSPGDDTSIATEKAIRTAIAAIIAAADAWVFVGVINCSGNPDYPAADCGHTYRVSVAGKIGGVSGPNVEVADILLCTHDGTASGNHATVGSYWEIIQANIDGAVIGPVSATDGHLALFDGASGKLIKDGGAPSGGDVVGPAGATSGHLATYDGATGKLIKDGGAIPSTVRMLVFTVENLLTIGTGVVRIYNKSGAAITISQVFIAVNTAPTGSTIIVDIDKNGTTIFTNQANRPVINASAFTGFSTSIDVPALADGDYLTSDIDQIGSTIAGANLTVHVIYS